MLKFRLFKLAGCITLLSFIPYYTTAQVSPLEVGVPVNEVIYVFQPWSIGTGQGCDSSGFHVIHSISSDIIPFVTGLDYFIVIDSLDANPGSALNSYTGQMLNQHDTISIDSIAANGSLLVAFDFSPPFYYEISTIIKGIPQVAGEMYPCLGPALVVAAGQCFLSTNLIDNTSNLCPVLGPSGISNDPLNDVTIVYFINSTLHVSLGTNELIEKTISLYGIGGNLIFREKIYHGSAEIYPGVLAPGLYFWEIKNGIQVNKGKVLKSD